MTTPARRSSSGAFSAADHVQAAGDALAHRYGTKPADLHPLAEGLIRGEPFSLQDAADVCLEAAGHRLEASWDPYRTILAAMTTATYPALLEQTWRGVAEARRSPQLEKLLALTAQLEVKDYRAQSFSMVDLGGLEAPNQFSSGEFLIASPVVTGEPIQTYSTFVQIAVSRQALQNDDRNLIRSAISAFLRSAHSAEMTRLVQILQSNANLQDGSPLFHDDHGNQVTAAAVDATSLAAAMRKLRDSRTEGGDRTDADPYALLVGSEAEGPALVEVQKFPEANRPRVIATAHIQAANEWYLFAAPDTFPVIGRTRLEGAALSCVSFGSFETDDTSPGVLIPATHSVGYSVLSRVGAVRVGGE